MVLSDMNIRRLFFLFFFTATSWMFPRDFSIGPRIVTQKGKLTFQEFFLHTQLNRGRLSLLSTDFGYGTSKNTGLQLNIPVVLSAKVDDKKTAGLGNLLLIGQWHFYKRPMSLGIALFGIKFPTSTTSKEVIRRGKGAFGFIFDVWWYSFV